MAEVGFGVGEGDSGGVADGEVGDVGGEGEGAGWRGGEEVDCAGGVGGGEVVDFGCGEVRLVDSRGGG